MSDSGSPLAQAIARFRAQSPPDEITNLLTVLSTLGMHLVGLHVINVHDLDNAKSAVHQAFSYTSPTFAARYETLDDEVQCLVACGMVLCAECYPMHIYYGFGVGVFKDFEFATKCWESGTCAELDRAISALKDQDKNMWLLKKKPEGMDKIVPNKDKIIMKDRKTMVKVREDLSKRIEKKGFPQPLDKSFTINTWWIPYATWDSTFLLYNDGSSFERTLRWQLDPGRLLYAFVVDRELSLRDGEVMLVPAGPAECLVRWLEGLDGLAIKLIPETDLNFKKLGLSSSTKDTMHYSSRRDAYVIRDSRASATQNTAMHMPLRAPMHSPRIQPPVRPPMQSPSLSHSQPEQSHTQQESSFVAPAKGYIQPEKILIAPPPNGVQSEKIAVSLSPQHNQPEKILVSPSPAPRQVALIPQRQYHEVTHPNVAELPSEIPPHMSMAMTTTKGPSQYHSSISQSPDSYKDHTNPNTVAPMSVSKAFTSTASKRMGSLSKTLSEKGVHTMMGVKNLERKGSEALLDAKNKNAKTLSRLLGGGRY